MTQPMYSTSEGLDKLKAELEHLRTVRRQEVADKIQQSRERGGNEGNAELEDAKNELAFTEGRIQTLINLISNSIIIEEGHTVGDTVQMGSKVRVKNQDGKTLNYTITGSTESDPTQGKISNVSPIGKGLLGKKSGEVAEVNIPSGTIRLEIVSIK